MALSWQVSEERHIYCSLYSCSKTFAPCAWDLSPWTLPAWPLRNVKTLCGVGYFLMPDLTSFTVSQPLTPHWGHLQKPPTTAEQTFWEDVPPVQTFHLCHRLCRVRYHHGLCPVVLVPLQLCEPWCILLPAWLSHLCHALEAALLKVTCPLNKLCSPTEGWKSSWYPEILWIYAQVNECRCA